MTNNFDPREYWERRLSADYNLSGVGYLGLGKAYNAWLYRLRRYIFLQTVRDLGLNISELSILDIGSGTGFYIDLWLELGAKKITGLDISQVAVDQLAQRYPGLIFFCADISNTLPGEITGPYDVISAFDVLFHIVDDHRFERAIQNIAGRLRTGQYLLFSDNFLHLGRQSGKNQVSRTLSEISELLDRAGLERVARRPMFALMNAPVDSDNRILHFYWKLNSWLISRSNTAGYLIGGLLYLVDRLALQLLTEGPSTELMVCRRQLTTG